MAREISPRIIVQGGGYCLALIDHLTEEYRGAIKESAKKGYATLMNGGSAVEAAEAAVRFLEDNEHFNAGRGSVLNDNGEVECEAMIMDGHTLDYGAVTSARHFRNPVSLSKLIMKKSDHCALSGDGALEFAKEQNFPGICDPKDLITQHAINRGNITYKDFPVYVAYHCMGKPVNETLKPTYDTVSAVAMDAKGHLACATSTGGIPGKLKGRIGDAPLIGCGGYANKEGGAATTGHGESLMKMTLAREVVYNMENGQDAQESAEKAMKKMEDCVHGSGGVIAIDKNGKFGIDFNTTVNVWASIKDNTLEFGFEKNEKNENIRETEHLQ